MAPQQLRSATENVATVLLLYSIWQYNEEYTGVDGNSFAYMYTSFHSFLPKVDRYTWTDPVCWFSSYMKMRVYVILMK